MVGIEVNGSARNVRFSDGATVDAHAVILATGVSYRRLEAPGVGELTGRGVYYGSAMSEAADCVGQDVYIVGGANSAGQAAVYFSRRRPIGDHPGPRPLPRRVDVVLPGAADRGYRQHHGAHLH